ncbi:uncharacterized protein LOC107365122 [Tetranychus urticae]|uniref:uncharacterized protein LOC107365122 n=1 Tax=Tetranychus urticae TaxID=32264 RepID=UPI00077BD4C0|nr:uncharacterized protein LOC107365122 [Tetranychus urticae]
MLINDNHCVQAQREILRFCRTTGCDNRTPRQVLDQCSREYGSNRIRSASSCGGGLFRYECCTRCLDVPCTNRAIGEIARVCRNEWSKERFRRLRFRIFTRNCVGGGTRYNCCLVD